MESFLSLLARSTGEDRGSCPHTGARLRIQPRGPFELDDGPLLLGISRMLRRLRVPARLAHFQGREPDPPICGEPAAEREHPDAADVLSTCRERHPDWEHVTIKGIWAVYCFVLRERCEIAIQRFLAAEPLPTRRRVYSAICAEAPHAADEHPLMVWARLVWRQPGNLAYQYDPNQVRVAWFEVVAARRRTDTLGAPRRSRAAQRIWSRAVRKIASELKLKVRFLTGLPIESLQWSEETSELNLPGARQCVQLSAECRRDMLAWIELRGFATGNLFSRPRRDAQPHQVLLSSNEVKACRAAANNAPWQALDDCWTIEALCAADDTVAHAYLFDRLLGSGDWPVEVIQKLSLLNGGAPRALSKDQEKRVRVRLCQRLAAAAEPPPATAGPLRSSGAC